MTRETDELRAELVMCQSENAYLRGKAEVYEAAIAASHASGEAVRPASPAEHVRDEHGRPS